MKILSIQEAAENCGKSQKTLRRAIAAGKLTATKIQNHYRINSDDLKKWIKKEPIDTKEDESASISQNIINWVDISDEWYRDGWKHKKDLNGLNFIDLFSGAGGLSCGLVMAGFTPIASVEIMPQAVETYEYNFINKKHFKERESYKSTLATKR